ncbi:MAG: hypothetical protein H7X71_06095, partial [Chitinophagales bacterium]|nr:hypothetical protein [Chitinophagales bacterium]
MKNLCFFLFVFCTPFVHAQTISGIINIYTVVTDVSGSDITVESASGFFAGDRVLIMQMKGAEVDETDDDTFGDILNYNSAGFYEFADVVSVSGSVITIGLPFCHTFQIAGKVQLIRVPVYTDVTISGEVTAEEWDGEKGGVVAFEASGTVTLNANINVAGLGFSGGGKCNGGFACAADDYALEYSSGAYFDCFGGQKGEAIAEVDEDINGGRGKLANGGGGSNSGQHGGSGGGNFGGGGRSAFEWTGCGVYDEIWAPGAVALDYSVDRVFFGGGGGGGHQDNGLSVTDGANGGGIVIINASTIDGLGYTISAAGNAVEEETDSEGAGGGGGGGSVILRIDNFPSDLMIDVHGGDGGDITSTLWAGTCHGPGGGGGGGYAGFSAASLPATVTENATGGEAGIINSAGAFCDDTPHGAENGVDGGAVFNLADLIYPVADLGPDITVCEEDNFELDAGEGYASYEWSTGETTQTIIVNVTGNYTVIVTNAFGCAAEDDINITVLESPVINLPDEIQFCEGEFEILDAGDGFTSYEWQDG